MKDKTHGLPVLSLRLMDDTYIMCEDENSTGVKVDIECRHLSPRWPNPLYSTYYRKLFQAYGIGPVSAWLQNRMIGFLPLSVTNCGIPDLPLCVHYTGGLAYGADRHIGLAMIEQAEAVPFQRLHLKEIRIGCMTVNDAFHGRNLSAEMVNLLLAAARECGWERVRARAMLDGEPEAFYPTLSWWQKLGFTSVGEVRPFGPSADQIDQARSFDLIIEL